MDSVVIYKGLGNVFQSPFLDGLLVDAILMKVLLKGQTP